MLDGGEWSETETTARVVVVVVAVVVVSAAAAAGGAGVAVFAPLLSSTIRSRSNGVGDEMCEAIGWLIAAAAACHLASTRPSAV